MPNNNVSTQALSYEQADLLSQFRILVSKMTYLIRFYIVENLTGVGDPEVTFNEILKVPFELNQLVSHLPGAATDTSLLTSNYLNALKNLLDGMITKDQAKSDESVRMLYEISEQIAESLAKSSPYWDECKWRDLFYRYNRDLIAEAFAILTGDYVQALDIFQGFMQTAQSIGEYQAEAAIHALPENQRQIPLAYYNMLKDFRQIGTEWAYLSRFYMVAKIVGIGNDQDVIQRFYNLTRRIKEKVELILGTEIADELANSLLIYVIRIEELIDAILSGDSASVEAKSKAVFQYGNQLSEYLGSVNPYWDREKWEELFDSFVVMLVEQINNLNGKEYVEAMLNFELLLYSSLAISDYFALGLFQYTE